jgi:hypothetical protein
MATTGDLAGNVEVCYKYFNLNNAKKVEDPNFWQKGAVSFRWDEVAVPAGAILALMNRMDEKMIGLGLRQDKVLQTLSKNGNVLVLKMFSSPALHM